MAVKEITLPSGRKAYQARWRDNTRKQRSKNFTRKVDAQAYERRMLADLDAGTYTDRTRGKITVTAWSAEWLAGAHNLRPRAKLAYERDLVRILDAIGALRLDQVTDTHLDDYLTGLTGTLAPATVHHHYRTLRRMFRVAVQRGRLVRSPLEDVATPRVPPAEMRFLTAMQLEGLAAVPSLGAYRTLILVAGWGGLRWGELAGLRVGRIDVERARVHVVTQLDPEGTSESEPKSAAGRRWVTLPRSVVDELATAVEDRPADERAWTSPTGRPLRHSNFLRRTFAPAAVTAGLGEMTDTESGGTHYEGLTPHDLRHTAVALAIADGAHPKAIQGRMGHSSIIVTLDRYGHLFPEMDAELGQRLDDTRSTALAERRKLRAV